MPDGASSRRRRPGRGRGRARVDPARVRRRAPAPAAAPARRADPLRGAALAGDRGRRAARDERRLGQQRAPAGARDARGERRSTPASRRPRSTTPSAELLARYVDAFERYDMDALTSLHPRGRDPVDAAVRPLAARPRRHPHAGGSARASAASGSRVIPTIAANGSPAFGQYKPSATGGGYEPWALQVLEIEDGRIAELTFFLDTETLFPLFGLPARGSSRSVRYSAGRRVRPMKATSSRSSSDALRRRTVQPWRRARELEPRERVDGHRVRRDRRRRRRARRRPRSTRAARRHARRAPAGRHGPIGPQIANVIVRGRCGHHR